MSIEIERTEKHYTIRLATGKVIKILIDDIEVFAETIGTNREGLIDFRITQQLSS